MTEPTEQAPPSGPMISPARAHLQRIAAAAAQAPEAQRPSAAGHEHQLLLAQLYEHRKQLKAIQSVEKKIEAKRTLLADYDAYIDGVLQADGGGADRIVTTIMVWCIDAGRYMRALAMASYVIKHGLQLPDQYQRTVPTLLADEISAAALAGRIPEENQGAILAHTLALVGNADIPDQARAKLHKAIGYAILGKQDGQPEPDYKTMPTGQVQDAQQHLQRALDLFAQVGVKKDLERIARRLKGEPDAPSQADPAPGGGVGQATAKTARG